MTSSSQKSSCHIGLVLSPPTDTGDSLSCTLTTTSESHRRGNQEKNHQDLFSDVSQDGISCPCIKVCVSYTYCKKLSQDFGYICLLPSHNKMREDLEKLLYSGYSICIKIHQEKANVNPVDRTPEDRHLKLKVPNRLVYFGSNQKTQNNGIGRRQIYR